MGGWALERTRTVTCDTTNANALFYCDQTGELSQSIGPVSIPFGMSSKSPPRIRCLGRFRPASRC